jgi:hypothetical protein
MPSHLRSGRLAAPLAVLAGALMSCWPAMLNGYPLVYFGDSIGYFRYGAVVARALLHREPHVYAERSEIYALGIFLVHWNRSAWPVVALQAVLTSYAVWLTLRSIVPRRRVMIFLILMALLSALTSMSWFVSLMMPDVLGGALYLGIYLLLFARESLSRGERWGVSAMVAWTAGCHVTHLMVCVALCAFLAAMLLAGWEPMAGRGRALAGIAALVCLSVGALYWLHGYLYGRATLNGNHPPFLMARILADGPGRWYLQSHCAQLDWYVCSYLNDTPEGNDAILWAPRGLWSGASYQDQQRLLNEERPLVLGTLRAYPWAELARALGNAGRQLKSYCRLKLWVETVQREDLYATIPGARAEYPHSLQARRGLPYGLFTWIHRWVVLACGLGVAALLPVVWRRRRPRLISLTVLIAAAILANAFATAVFSGPAARYEGRIVWLVPLLASLMAIDLLSGTADAGG